MKHKNSFNYIISGKIFSVLFFSCRVINFDNRFIFFISSLLICTSSTSEDFQQDASLDSTSTNLLLDIGLCLYFNYPVHNNPLLKLPRYFCNHSKKYHFKQDVNPDGKRAFRSEWLTAYP